ncbi:hypothetical protein NP511_10725 [Natrinema thermotolerans]|uniref:Uncharacterized protein n=1 Tax=Natrinema thermotolerans TaxID=121872 RepID=A0AAF0T0X2_9EURY|nr:hypothetical protein [Natrinema thermotolerans]QCC58920.1 hypothetical protein DVR14_09865 [Natrinema thermotolerans]WMT10081.1 hypothetical protein NP511_10725 [Natrinema thermotolerans]
MMWQDLVFMLGSGLSIVFLAPTLRDSSARVPLGTSLPSMGIGFVYATTFFTLGMTFSAMGAFAAGSMWSLIALFRSPQGISMKLFARENLALFVSDLQYWLARRRSADSHAEQYLALEQGREQQY